MTTAAPSDTAAVTPNSCASGIEPKKPAVQPASRFPSQFDRKKTPIMRLTMRVGASFVTALKPTGLRHSSPISSIVYAATSHSGLTLIPAQPCGDEEQKRKACAQQADCELRGTRWLPRPDADPQPSHHRRQRYHHDW